MTRFIIILGFLILVQNSWAQKEETSKSIPKEEAIRILKDAIAKKKDLSPTEQAESFYEYQTDDRPCPHCPEYLKLIREVNRIVEKVPAKQSESISLQNESLIQLNRLKFMYYEVKLQEENGGERCLQFQHADPLRKKLVTDENSIVLVEEMLSLPNVTSFQYVPGDNEKEVRYYYKGEGPHRDIIIEIILYPDRRAVIRYRKMKENEFNLPDLGTSTVADKPVIKPETMFNIGSALATGEKDEIKRTVLQQEIDITEKKGEVELSEGLNFSAGTKAKLNQQSLAVALKDEKGKDWVKVDVEHKTLKHVEVSTVIPMEVKLDEKGLALGGAVSLETHKDYEGESTQTKTLVFGLTDHNHEYLRATVVKAEDLDKISLSSRYSIGEYGNVSGMVTTDSLGRKEYSVGHGVKDKDSSMTTRYGMTSDARKFFEFEREQRIGKTQSMVLTLRTDDRHETTVMYQYKVTLK